MNDTEESSADELIPVSAGKFQHRCYEIYNSKVLLTSGADALRANIIQQYRQRYQNELHSQECHSTD